MPELWLGVEQEPTIFQPRASSTFTLSSPCMKLMSAPGPALAAALTFPTGAGRLGQRVPATCLAGRASHLMAAVGRLYTDLLLHRPGGSHQKPSDGVRAACRVGQRRLTRCATAVIHLTAILSGEVRQGNQTGTASSGSGPYEDLASTYRILLTMTLRNGACASCTRSGRIRRQLPVGGRSQLVLDMVHDPRYPTVGVQ